MTFLSRPLLGVLASIATLCLGACANESLGPGGGPSPPPPSGYQPGASQFNAHDFAWSTSPGAGAIIGSMTYHEGETRYSCAGRDVILMPETPWSRRRMFILYGSAVAAALPLEIVRARTPAATSDDYATYARKTTCDGASHFRFAGLPDGAWFVITVARPSDAGEEPVAVMRRVETHGAPRNVVLN